MFAPKFAAVGIFFLAISTSFVSCQSNEGGLENDSVDAEIRQNENLRDEANRAEIHADYAAFKVDANLKIAENERRIATLKVKVANTDGEAPLDNMRVNRIDELEKQNAKLRVRLDDYERSPSDWENFKSEFNHDMNSIMKGFDDLGENNVNK